MKEDQSLANKNVQCINSSGKPLPDSYNNYRPKAPYQNDFAEVSRTEEFHKIIHKTDVEDQRIRIIGLEISIQDQTQIEVITQKSIEIILIQTLETKLF